MPPSGVTAAIGGYPKGAQALAVALKTNLALTTLDLHGNSTGENGLNAPAMALDTNVLH
ncbi:hypothetical protein BG006_008575 [Podila minutissima]|uniref:Uncharacterized protein n=1 Tax=Podila minutissima TaxID=64525 RepID=A0A9P5SFW9_9FUNG|nr:hypothetical protein BG006_008575 [Podila minutissima]